MSNSNIYLSIGCQCNPRMYIKNTLNLSKIGGYKSGPFDLCITPFDSLCECLKTNFKHFFDDLHTISGVNSDGDRSMCGPGLLNITNYYGMTFNYEGATHSHLFTESKNDDEFYIRNDFYEFKKRYSSRIKNFIDYIENNNEITLVHSLYPGICDERDLSKIRDILEEKYPGKEFKFIELR